jgi:hypothetical protein
VTPTDAGGGPQPPAIAFVTTYDASDMSVWSGIAYHMAQALERRTAVDRIGPLRDALTGRILAGELANRLRGRRVFRRERDASVARSYARQVEARLRGGRAGAGVSPPTNPSAHPEKGLAAAAPARC